MDRIRFSRRSFGTLPDAPSASKCPTSPAISATRVSMAAVSVKRWLIGGGHVDEKSGSGR